MKRAVKEALDEADINIPFPTRTVIYEKAAASGTEAPQLAAE